MPWIVHHRAPPLSHVRQLTDRAPPPCENGRQRMIVMARHIVPFALGIVAPLTLVSWLILQ